jgi:hypothetical protein
MATEQDRKLFLKRSVFGTARVIVYTQLVYMCTN